VRRSVVMMCTVLAAMSAICAAQADVRTEPADNREPRHLQEQTQSAAVRDYLKAWQSLRTALDRNDAALLEPDFVGIAQEKLAATVNQQAALGVHTRYRDKSHDIKIVFDSPEGLSLELTDDVQYDVEMLARDTVHTTRQVRAHYVVVLTPAEVRWRVRVFQESFE
jgi:hypothetical protein